MKRTAIMVLALVIGLLSGCGNSSSDQQETAYQKPLEEQSHVTLIINSPEAQGVYLELKGIAMAPGELDNSKLVQSADAAAANAVEGRVKIALIKLSGFNNEQVTLYGFREGELAVEAIHFDNNQGVIAIDAEHLK